MASIPSWRLLHVSSSIRRRTGLLENTHGFELMMCSCDTESRPTHAPKTYPDSLSSDVRSARTTSPCFEPEIGVRRTPCFLLYTGSAVAPSAVSRSRSTTGKKLMFAPRASPLRLTHGVPQARCTWSGLRDQLRACTAKHWTEIIPTLEMDYFYVTDESKGSTALAAIDRSTGHFFTTVPKKSPNKCANAVEALARYVSWAT